MKKQQVELIKINEAKFKEYLKFLDLEIVGGVLESDCSCRAKVKNLKNRKQVFSTIDKLNSGLDLVALYNHDLENLKVAREFFV